MNKWQGKSGKVKSSKGKGRGVNLVLLLIQGCRFGWLAAVQDPLNERSEAVLLSQPEGHWNTLPTRTFFDDAKAA